MAAKVARFMFWVILFAAVPGYLAYAKNHAAKNRPNCYSVSSGSKNTYSKQSGSSRSITVPLPPSESSHYLFNPVANLAQGDYCYGFVKVDRIFNAFYVTLSKNLHPTKVVFDALTDSGAAIDQSVLIKPPFYATWHQSISPAFRITAIHYILYFKKGKPVERTYSLIRDYRTIFVPAP